MLFLEAGDGSRARRAEFWARELGGGWLEPAAALIADCEGGQERSRPAGNAEGPDLRVVLETTAGVTPVDGEAGSRIKRWPLGPECLHAHGDICDQRIRQRVAGLIGGLHMKAREDADEGADPE